MQIEYAMYMSMSTTTKLMLFKLAGSFTYNNVDVVLLATQGGTEPYLHYRGIKHAIEAGGESFEKHDTISATVPRLNTTYEVISLDDLIPTFTKILSISGVGDLVSLISKGVAEGFVSLLAPIKMNISKTVEMLASNTEIYFSYDSTKSFMPVNYQPIRKLIFDSTIDDYTRVVPECDFIQYAPHVYTQLQREAVHAVVTQWHSAGRVPMPLVCTGTIVEIEGHHVRAHYDNNNAMYFDARCIEDLIKVRSDHLFGTVLVTTTHVVIAVVPVDAFLNRYVHYVSKDIWNEVYDTILKRRRDARGLRNEAVNIALDVPKASELLAKSSDVKDISKDTPKDTSMDIIPTDTPTEPATDNHRNAIQQLMDKWISKNPVTDATTPQQYQQAFLRDCSDAYTVMVENKSPFSIMYV